ncbi:MAG: SufE family protein [Verrucomicrobia bacterium]|nr:SufE family protein [Verrucomicrobiota bacterium]
MSETIRQKIFEINQRFTTLPTGEARYTAIIEMGRTLPSYPNSLKTPERIVKGCQSTLYLDATLKEGKVYFQTSSEALISAGLAALLIAVYSGETPQTILTTPPDFLKDLGISASLSPNRSNGLYQIHLRMKQLAIPFLNLS